MRMKDYIVKTDWGWGGGVSHTVPRAFKARRTRLQSGGNHICERFQGLYSSTCGHYEHFLDFANLNYEEKVQQLVWN